jgi:hypothetical protein
MFLAPIRYDAVHQTDTRNETEQQAFHNVEYFTLRVPSEDGGVRRALRCTAACYWHTRRLTALLRFCQSTLMHTSAKSIDTVAARVDAR